MNTFKKTGGFTLVELIIVIAILAILSSVAVAGYSTYIKKANNSAVESFLNEIETHAILANAEAGNVGTIKVEVVKDANGNATGDLKVTIEAATPGFAKNFESNFKAAYTGISNWDHDDYVAGQPAEGENAAVPEVKENYNFTVKAPSAWNNSDYADGTNNEGGKWN